MIFELAQTMNSPSSFSHSGLADIKMLPRNSSVDPNSHHPLENTAASLCSVRKIHDLTMCHRPFNLLRRRRCDELLNFLITFSLDSTLQFESVFRLDVQTALLTVQSLIPNK